MTGIILQKYRGTGGSSDHVFAGRPGRERPLGLRLGVMGRAAAHVVSCGTSGRKRIDRIGQLHDCVAYGPGKLDLAHQPDEYVAVDDMVDAAIVAGLALADLLGAAEA